MTRPARFAILIVLVASIGTIWLAGDRVVQVARIWWLPQERIARGDGCLSPFNQQFPELVRQTREQIPNPGSFQHIETERTGMRQGRVMLLMRYTILARSGRRQRFDAFGLLDPRTCEVTMVATASEER